MSAPSTNTVQVPSQTLDKILEEIRLLRKDVELLLPQEDLEDYAHPERIKDSYYRAIKQYPTRKL